jgi:hypothetical protein
MSKDFKLVSKNIVECAWCGLRIETGVFNIGQHVTDCPIRRRDILKSQEEVRRQLNQIKP